MAHIYKIYRFIENTSKMTFPEKNKTFCVKMLLVLFFIHDIIMNSHNIII